jgi:hypothetical protein
MNTRPNVPALCTFALLPLAVVACNTSPPAGGAPSASAPATVSAAAPAPTPAEPAPPPPNDLDVAALQKTLKCAQDAKSGPCAVLASFKACKEWNPVVPSGDGRWMGRGSVVEGGKTTNEITLLRSKRVPTTEAGVGQLPARIAVTAIPATEKVAVEQAERAIRQFERHDVVPKSNAGLEFVKNLDSWPDAPARRTVGGQVLVVSPDGDTFVCQGPKQQLVVVRKAKGGSATGDGTYAEVWATTW